MEIYNNKGLVCQDNKNRKIAVHCVLLWIEVLPFVEIGFLCSTGRKSDSIGMLRGLWHCPAYFLDTLLRIFAQVPEFEALGP